MCGIVGWIDWNRDLTHEKPRTDALIDQMTDTLKNRGPDARGTWLSEHAALGHRRLTVVDPAGGAQPMVRRRGDHTYVITYNGELYNTPELRKELEARGYTFQGHSDTEVLLTSYIEWGPACVKRLNGIYAFGVWSERDQSLFLARDRLGVKPLFYAQQDGAFFFASEPKALLAHPAIRPEIDTQGLIEIFVVGPARTPGHGIFRQLAEVRPGYCLLATRAGVQMEQYWSLVSRPHEDDLETTTRRLRQLFEDTVDRQLVADVPVCTFLSGGLDSSAITALAAKHFQEHDMGPLHTWSVDYVDNDRHFKPTSFQPNSDTPWIQRMAETCKTEHHFITIDTPELVEALTEATMANDRPGMVDIDASLLLFCREIKKGATVALSGESADEVFGGYPWFYCSQAMRTDTFPWARGIQERARLLSPDLTLSIDPVQYMAERYQEALDEVPRLPGEDPDEAYRRELFYLNITRFMPTLLDRKDRMSMGVGLEVRVPFCDHRLIEYAWNIPWSMKYLKEREKGLLREALTGIMPDDVLWRKKSPYPKTHHPAYMDAVRGWIQEILDDPSSPLLGLVNVDMLRQLIGASYDTSEFPWFGQLMAKPQLFAYLGQINLWLKEYNVKVCL